MTVTAQGAAQAPEIAFVDTSAADWERLAAAVGPGIEVVLLEPGREGLAQIADALSGRTDVSAIHLIAHGRPGAVLLGGAWLDLQGLDASADTLAGVGAALRPGADILIYGCDVAATETGQAFVEALARATGADVAASDDLTGLASLGGDETLEFASGAIEAQAALAWSEGMPTLAVWEPVALKPNPPGDNYGEGIFSGESLGSSYEQGGIRFGWNGYAEEDSHGIAFGTHWTGQVGVDFVRAEFGAPNTELTFERVDGSEFWLREVTLSLGSGGPTEWTFTGYRDGQAVTPSVTVSGLENSAYIPIVDPSFANVDKVVVTSEEPIVGLGLSVKHSDAVEGTVSAKLAPGDIAVIGVDSVASDAAFVAVRDLPGDHFVFITTAGWNSETGAWRDPNMSLLPTDEMVITWKTPPEGVAAGTVFNLADMPGGVTDGYIIFNAPTDPYFINDQLTIFDLEDSGSLDTPNFVYAVNVTSDATAANGFYDTFTGGVGAATWAEGGVPTGLTAAADGGLGSAFGLMPDGTRTALKSGVLQDGMSEEEVLRAIHTASNWESAEDWDASYDFATRFDDIVIATGAVPEATNLSQTVTYTEDAATAVALGDIVVSDADPGETITATLTLSDVAAGVLSTGNYGSATSTYDSGTGVWTVTGSVADANAALAAVAFAPAADWDQDVTVATRIRDAAGTGPADGAITLDVTGVNDAPTATNLTQTVPYTEDPGGSVALGDIVVSDVDAGDTITATLTLSEAAAGALSAGTYGSATSTFNAGTGVWTVAGSAADVSAALAAVSFTPAANWDQDVTVTTRIRDAAGTGPAEGTISLDVTAVNDAPTASNLTQTASYTEDSAGAVALGDIVVSDADAGETITATLTLSEMAAGALSTGSYGSATSTYNAGTGVWTVTGSAADVNAALAAVAFTPAANRDQDVTVTTRVRDAAGTGPADGVITLDVTGVNDAPTATNLTQTVAYTEDPGGSVALGDIVVSDVDTGDTITAILTLSSPAAGALSVGTYGSAAATFNAGTGVWTVVGSAADVNAALAAVAFTPAANWDQDVTVTTRIRDAAGTGPADGTITLDVTAVNDAPVITAPPSIAVTEDVASAVTGVSVSDADAGSGTIVVTLSLTDGALAATSGGGVTVGGTAQALTLTGTLPDINTFVAGANVTYTTAKDAGGAVTLTVEADDGGATGSGGAAGDSATVSLAITAVNDAPSADPAAGFVNAGAATSTGGLVTLSGALLHEGDIDDADAGVTFTVTTATTEGTLFLDANGNNAADDGEYLDAGETFTQADLDAGQVKYRHGGGGGTGDSFGFSVADGGEDAAAPLTGQTFAFSIAERPLVTIGAGAAAYVEDGAAAAIAPGLTITDSDSPLLAQASVTITDFVSGDVLGFTDQNGITGAYNAATGVLTLSGAASAADYQAALRSVTFGSTSDNPASGAGAAERTIRVTVSDGGLTSLGADAAVTVQNANDAPTLDAAESPALAGLAEDAGPPADGSTTGSTLVSALLSGANDVDTGALAGVAVTGVSPQGTLWWSIDAGASWTEAGPLSDSAALLLASDARVYFQPNADVSGTITALTIRAWDRTGGTEGETADVSAVGGGSAVSATSDTVSIVVSNSNDPPTGAVTISGAARVGSTLSVSHTLADPDGLGPVSYQWFADGAPIDGATGTSLTLNGALLGKAITVEASYTDLGGTVEALTSGATAAVSNPPPTTPPTPPPVTETVDGVPVQTQTGTQPDGTPTQTVTIPVVVPSREEQVGDIEMADIPLVVGGLGNPFLTAQVPIGFGLQISGFATPKAAGSSLTDLIREIRAHTARGSDDQTLLSGGGSGFLGGLPADAPLLVQTVVPTAGADGSAPAGPLVIHGAGAGGGAPQTALVIDTRGLPNGAQIQLQNVEFAAVIGAVDVSGGAGAQNVWGDSANQSIVLGEGDDVLHGGGGDDTVGSESGDDRLFGDDGNDVVFGGVGGDLVQGNTGSDTVSGDAGDDFVYGGQGDDRAFGGEGADHLSGDLGDDVLQGNMGQDTLYAGEGADTLYGGQDRDHLFGGAGGDLLFGDKGNDHLQGNGEADELLGGDGDDLLHGGQGDDTLAGEDGDDWLSGDQGDDVLSGGAGADVFMTARGAGTDRVLDFDVAGGDRVYVDPRDRYTLSQEGADAVIDLGGGDRLILANVQVSSLGDNWIIGA